MEKKVEKPNYKPITSDNNRVNAKIDSVHIYIYIYSQVQLVWDPERFILDKTTYVNANHMYTDILSQFSCLYYLQSKIF